MIAGVAVARLRLSNTQLSPFRSPWLQPQASLPSTRRVALSRCATRIFPSTCSEVLDSALHPIVLAIGFHRVDRVVVCCTRLETVHAHAENGIGMARVYPDWRFRRLAQVRRMCTIVHDAVMLGRTPGIIAFPANNGRIVVCRFELWPLRDPDPCSFLSRRTLLRSH